KITCVLVRAISRRHARAAASEAGPRMGGALGRRNLRPTVEKTGCRDCFRARRGNRACRAKGTEKGRGAGARWDTHEPDSIVQLRPAVSREADSERRHQYAAG